MFSQIFIERPKLAIVISLVMVLAGAICITKLPVAEYPEIAPPKINVEAVYTGASAEVIADNVYFGDSKRDGDSGYSAPAYGAAPAMNPYAAPAYAAPAAPAPASDFSMIEDDDSQLPF